MVTCSVNVKVCRFVGHISRLLQSRPAGLNSGRVTHGLRNIHHEGTSVNVLPSKQHLHLRGAGTHGPVRASDGSLPSLINLIGNEVMKISRVETLQYCLLIVGSLILSQKCFNSRISTVDSS